MRTSFLPYPYLKPVWSNSSLFPQHFMYGEKFKPSTPSLHNVFCPPDTSALLDPNTLPNTSLSYNNKQWSFLGTKLQTHTKKPNYIWKSLSLHRAFCSLFQQHTNKCTYIVFNNLKFTLKHLKRSYMFRSYDHSQGATLFLAKVTVSIIRSSSRSILCSLLKLQSPSYDHPQEAYFVHC